MIPVIVKLCESPSRADHIVWIPKYRKKSIYKDLRKYLGATLKDLALQKECTIEEGHLMSGHVMFIFFSGFIIFSLSFEL
jgi:REP element-mobilizing transposase RayT